MKNTRIERLRQSKRVKQATKLLTVGLLVCPLAIGTIKALADEAETTPPVEQLEETPATIEEVAPVEETETSEPAQPEVVEETQTEEPISTESVEQPSQTQEETPVLEDIEKEEPETFAVKASYSENFYTSSENPMWGGDYCMYTYTFSNGSVISFHFNSPDFNSFTWLMSDYVDDEYISIEGSATSGQAISFDFNGNHYETSLTVDVIPTKKNCTVTFTTQGSGTLSSSPTIQVEEGTWLNINDYSSATAAEGWYFKGWSAVGLSSYNYSSIMVSDDTIVTAIFEQGSLDWSSYDQLLARYPEFLLPTKEAFSHFGFADVWETFNDIYQGYVKYRDDNLYSPTLSQDEVNSWHVQTSGLITSLVDFEGYFDYTIKPLIKDYHDSVKSIYDDSTTYTTESKQIFNDAWLLVDEKVQTGSWGQEKELFDAYQALKTAEQNLVKAETPTLDELVKEFDKKQAEATALIDEVKALAENTEFYDRYKDIYGDYDKVSFLIGNWQGTMEEYYAWGISEYAGVIDRLNALKDEINANQPEAPTTEKLESSIKDAESKLTESGYTAESMKVLRQALQNAKDVLANANSTQAEIDEAQKALDQAIAGLVKAEDPNSNNTGNSTTDPNTSNNGTADNTNNQSNNSSQDSNTATTKPTSNNVNKDGLPQTGEQSTTNVVIAGLSLTMLSILAWFKKKKV